MGKKVKKEVEPPPKDVFDPLSIESKKAATVVLMLNSPEEEVLAKACDAIYKFASKEQYFHSRRSSWEQPASIIATCLGIKQVSSDENKVTLLSLGAVEPLFKLVSHEDPLVRRNAIMVFGIMASNNDVRKLLRELDVTNSVIARLAPEEDIVVHEFASLCLAHMAVEYTSKVQIFEQGGLEPLIRLLSSPDPDVKKNSVECIYHLVQDFQSRAAVRELNAIPALLELLKSEYPVVQLLALKTFGVISNDRETRIILRENQGLDQLFKILETKEFNDLHVEALAVVANCLEDVDTMQLIQQTGGLKKLLSFAEMSTIPDIQKNAAKAITKTAYDPENRKILHEEEIEKCLITLLGTDNDGAKAAASQAISAMCENLASKDAFGIQGIPQLIQLLSSENEEVKEAAAIALANLTTGSPSNASAVAEAEGIEPLINILSAKRDGTVANAAAVLTNMAMQEPLRLSIHGVMNAIVEPLQSTNSLVQSKAALTVAALGCDADARTEVKPGVKLLSLEELSIQELNDHRAIILVNAKLPEVSLSAEDKSQDPYYGRTTSSSSIRKSSKERASAVVSPVEEKQDSSGRSPSSLSKSSTREKGSRKGKGKKEEDKPKEEEELQTMPKVQQEVILEKLLWLPPFDSILLDYIIDASKIILPLTTTKEQVVALALFVADKMGGPIERDKLHEFSWELHISEIEFELKCNVVPIGKIKKGTFYHRALLFKVIADRIGIGCSLVRGEYGRAWNEVKLVDDSPQGITGLLLPPQVYIVDLMYQPGCLMKQGSAEADHYQRI
ncbi:armadillo repeat-containing protein 3 isoform X4 [Terrapene carolina triunguis]|uniref:armadillo repeat-containing protein 3 isoform X4 n=1 Tax=Terrapene triunguis TaxID=2587831 RepID=UPI000E777062|nr:armadillo repeat-containing protein 3 isoform X4 [Terrapene carolina triunguis]